MRIPLEGFRVATQTVRMARSKKPDASQPDREKYRKPFTPVRIRNRLANAGKARAEELDQDFAQYVNDALRMRLESEGRWPPP